MRSCTSCGRLEKVLRHRVGVERAGDVERTNRVTGEGSIELYASARHRFAPLAAQLCAHPQRTACTGLRVAQWRESILSRRLDLGRVPHDHRYDVRVRERIERRIESIERPMEVGNEKYETSPTGYALHGLLESLEATGRAVTLPQHRCHDRA